MLWFFVLAVTLAYLWYRYRKEHFRFFEKRGIPGPEPGFIFGNSIEFMSNTPETLQRWNRIYGKDRFYGFFQGTVPMLVTTDLDFINRILIKEFPNFVNRSDFTRVDTTHPDMAKALIFAKDQNWKLHRNYITPVFTTRKLKEMLLPSLEVGCKMLLDTIDREAGHEIDVTPLIMNFQMDNVCRTIFGIDSNSLDKDGKPPLIVQNLRTLSNSFAVQWFNKIGMSFTWIIGLLETCFKLGLLSHPVDETARNVTQIVECRKKSEIGRKDFIGALLHAEAYNLSNYEALAAREDQDFPELKTASEGVNLQKRIPPMDSKTIMGQCLLFASAGLETTSITMCNTIYYLSKNMDIQDQLRSDILDAVEANGGELTYDLVTSIEALRPVIDEVLRISPPVSCFTTRQAIVEFEHNGIAFPRGTNIIIPTTVLQHDPEYFPEPEKFDPDRFSKERRSKIPQMAFQPFGDGPRNCIGMRFAYVIIRFTICKLLLNYRILPTSVTSKPLPGGMIFTYFDKVVVRMEKLAA